MFNSLQDKLDKALHNLSGRGKITEINVAETSKNIYCRKQSYLNKKNYNTYVSINQYD